ncbi:MAG: hypothetical protein DRG78_08410 [Epsilonproteobacteria bacterium]|nr:MAG: hypothetical protein DRG78_08410 [Campylobacterota bacterium]
MNIIDQVKPKRIKPVQEYSIKKVKVTELDSGDVKEYVEKVKSAESAESAVSQKSQNFGIFKYGIYSYCFLYIEYIKQFNDLISISEEHAIKFSDEYSYINYNNVQNSFNNDMIYLDKKYDSILIDIDIHVMTDTGIDIIKINDRVHYKDNTIIVPQLYDFISDNLAKIVNLNKINILNKETRKVRPIENFKINYSNKLYCDECLFKNICQNFKGIK